MYNNNLQLLFSFRKIVRPLFRNFIYLYIYNGHRREVPN